MHVYFGTYSPDREQGILRCDFDPDTGRLTPRESVAPLINPNFFALHPGGCRFYSVVDMQQPDGLIVGALADFDRDPRTGRLTHRHTWSAHGQTACHVALDPAATTAIVSNYSTGNVASFPLAADASPGPAASCIQHAADPAPGTPAPGTPGTRLRLSDSDPSPDPPRQPRAHSATVDRTGRFVIVADLGLDQLRIYRLDPATSRLTPHDPPILPLQRGAGPRHFAFHPNHRAAYILNELDSTLAVLDWDADRGVLSVRQTLRTLPDGYTGESYTSEVAVHPNGRFLYAANRGHDSLAIFAVDPASGQLTPAGHAPVCGRWPRHFSLDPTGRWMIVCNQHSGEARVFAVDESRGSVTPVGDAVSVAAVVCVLFAPAG